MKFPRLKRYFDAYKQGVKERLDKNYALNKSVGSLVGFKMCWHIIDYVEIDL